MSGHSCTVHCGHLLIVAWYMAGHPVVQIVLFMRDTTLKRIAAVVEQIEGVSAGLPSLQAREPSLAWIFKLWSEISVCMMPPNTYLHFYLADYNNFFVILRSVFSNFSSPLCKWQR